MSFSQPKAENPAKKFLHFKGDKGIFEYYDKDAEEKKEFYAPFYFIVLDQLSTISGFSNEYNSGIYSNEVHSLMNEILRVKTFKGGLSITGRYADIKDEVKSAGGKFTKSVYALLFNEKLETEIINFQLSGAAFSSWIDFKFSQQLHAVGFDGECTQEKTGGIKYQKPVFKRYNIKQELIDDAIKADKILQEFIKQRREEQAEKEAVKEAEPEKSDSGLHEYKTGEEVFHETNYEQDKESIYGNQQSVDNPESDLPF
jgi:hypothetical protein